MCKISIITINLNNKDGLEKSIKSVILQKINVDFIIIDGGSIDGSIEIIKKYTDKVDYWVSEKDLGVYNAMNKGVKKAKGEYLLFLNSGDYFFNENSLSKALEYAFDKDIIYGDLYLKALNDELKLKSYPEKLTFDYFINHESLPHPSSFIKRDLFEKIGYYNENFKIVSDWEFWLKAIFLNQASYKKVSVAIAVFDMHGMSSSPLNYELVQLEKEEIYKKYFSGIIEDYRKFYAERNTIDTNKYIRLLRRLKLLPHRLYS